MTVKRIHALKNTYSGVLGELKVAAEFVRCGIPVAKPYWNDDEIDLLAFSKISKQPPKSSLKHLDLKALDVPLIAIPIQIKSIQTRPATPKRRQSTRVYIKGLKKSYVERHQSLCLAIYNPEKDIIWFIAGAKNIEEAYNTSARRRCSYKDLEPSQDLRIYVDTNKTALQDNDFNKKWLLPANETEWLSQKIHDIIENAEEDSKQIACLEQHWSR